MSDYPSSFSQILNEGTDQIDRLRSQRDKLLAACQQTKDWLQLNNRTESVIYAPLCAVIAEVENSSPF